MLRHLGILIWALSALACETHPVDSGEVREAIERQNLTFIEAFMRGDAQAVANLYTENARVIAPGADVVTGRAAIASFWEGVIEQGVKDLTLETDSIESSGNLCSEDGIVKIVATDGSVTVGRYIVVWKRVNGEWKLHRDIWN